MTAQTTSYDGVHYQVVLMNMKDGSVQGHAEGCADLKRGKKFAEPFQADEFWDVRSKEQAREIYNADFDEETDGWYDIEWLPCAKHVPATEADRAGRPELLENDAPVAEVPAEDKQGVIEVKRGRKWTYVFVDGEQVMEVRTQFADQVLAKMDFFA